MQCTTAATVKGMADVSLIDALTMAMAWELEHDPRVIILGEDVGVNGGVFRATAGLQKRFGADRVQDTPLAEGMIAGVSIGMAVQGMRPVAEIQFMGFIYPTVDQMISHAGRMRNRTRGRLSCPMVLRAPYGGGIHAPEHHSESTEAFFAHMPGIRVVIPSSPARAYGLLLAAIRNADPVVFLEPKRIYRLNKQSVEDNGKELPLDVCYTLREGSDVTLVTWGAMTYETLKAADQLAKSGVSCEVIDLASISPIDYETILESVEKTGRLVIIHEAARTAGVGAEIAAIVAEKGMYDLRGPIRRVTGYDVVMPLFRREMDYMPSVAKITDTIRESLDD
ncbi:MAG TPA: alpha-ketoacid dehydrogenase subunit beta [Woeseiaceae bacterium]|nr:alpha-ketoacid dehydrogenase subunit beta [Woeseiaceae bacterium]